MPSRIVAVERRLGPAAAPLVVVTAVDAITGKSREEATGYVNDVWPRRRRRWQAPRVLLVGVAVPFYELHVDAPFDGQLVGQAARGVGSSSRPSWVE